MKRKSLIAIATLGVVAITAIAVYSTTLHESMRLVGACTAVGYFEGDMEQVHATNSTVTYGNSTSYTLVVTSVSTPTVQTVGTKTYAASYDANNASALVITSTSFDQAYAPSGAWTVTACTYPRGFIAPPPGMVYTRARRRNRKMSQRWRDKLAVGSKR